MTFLANLFTKVNDTDYVTLKLRADTSAVVRIFGRHLKIVSKRFTNKPDGNAEHVHILPFDKVGSVRIISGLCSIEHFLYIFIITSYAHITPPRVVLPDTLLFQLLRFIR
jgi:hypothetical protein